MIKDSLGDRMKANYENRSKTYLTRRTPVIIRLDGVAFHTFTKGLKKPFDDILIKSMQDTMKYLCENIQGCVLGYTQSDEITLVLIDYANLNTAAWFDYNVQKMCSVAASMASYIFNKTFRELVIRFDQEYGELWNHSNDSEKYINALWKCLEVGAFFDARCFNIPKEEVANCLLWRQKDAQRNSVNSLAQSLFSHKELQGKNLTDTKELIKSIGTDWEQLPSYLKWGSCCIKNSKIKGSENCNRGRWEVDTNIPLFIGDGRLYVESLIDINPFISIKQTDPLTQEEIDRIKALLNKSNLVMIGDKDTFKITALEDNDD